MAKKVFKKVTKGNYLAKRQRLEILKLDVWLRSLQNWRTVRPKSFGRIEANQLYSSVFHIFRVQLQGYHMGLSKKTQTFCEMVSLANFLGQMNSFETLL